MGKSISLEISRSTVKLSDHSHTEIGSAHRRVFLSRCMLLEVEDFLTSELVLFLSERHSWVEPN